MKNSIHYGDGLFVFLVRFLQSVNGISA